MVDIDAVRDWLGRLPGGSPGRYAEDWDAFQQRDRPVLTLFGSYDTGKSSLLRRLLVDSGRDVPDWLTISARHETFDVNDVDFGTYTVRDTPGFEVGASGVREQNNSRVMAAVALTDVGIAVLTPQLATAERDVLRSLLTRGWPAGTMWFVISRFDEAGENPEYDLAAYRDLGDRKVGELRNLLGLDDQVPVFVVSQDPFQTAGPVTDLDRGTWDEFRDWDGMQELTGALEAVSPSALPGWRHAAGQRYWSAVLGNTLSDLRGQLADYAQQATVAAHGVGRREQWERQLANLDRAARAGLEGLVDEVLRRSWDSGSAADELQRTVGEWFTRHESHLDRLRQSIRKGKERDRALPTWSGFASLVGTLRSGENTAPAADGPGQLSQHTSTIGSMLLGVLKTMTEDLGDTAGRKTTAVKMAEKVKPYVGTVEAALPLTVYLTALVDQHLANRTRLNQDRAAAEMRHQVVAECTRLVRDTWQPFVDDVHDEIVAQTKDEVDLDASLRQLVRHLHEAIVEGESLSR
ncbi:GTPase domain-containing protein [Micromonospora auratinigra]|uniref:50S ribosome-binding GTPase n=1 Tax=Micromonospora auratinigra TaxID=261654 RepID=A0A1A8Z9H8_9ACTN|nr:GTPase domain-containing protein [Micromonospora auratinigra]SBT40612.1 50S ribosome-binding GTPase [Micromonospora auratinigra]